MPPELTCVTESFDGPALLVVLKLPVEQPVQLRSVVALPSAET